MRVSGRHGCTPAASPHAAPRPAAPLHGILSLTGPWSAVVEKGKDDKCNPPKQNLKFVKHKREISLLIHACAAVLGETTMAPGAPAGQDPPRGRGAGEEQLRGILYQRIASPSAGRGADDGRSNNERMRAQLKLLDQRKLPHEVRLCAMPSFWATAGPSPNSNSPNETERITDPGHCLCVFLENVLGCERNGGCVAHD